MSEVSDVLRDRMQTPGGLSPMLTISVTVHLALAAALIFASGGLLKRAADPSRTVMTISLGGGSDLPQNGGLTPIGGAPVQTQRPPDEPVRREAIRPPAAKTPEMTMPLPNAKVVKPTPGPPVKQAPDEARGRTPPRGAQTSAGSTVADTGVRGQGFGLSTGGGTGSGSSLEITGDFCCPDYLATMITRIRSAWDHNQGAIGISLIRFTINRDGSITDATIFKGSGTVTLDTAALRAVVATRTLPPLPDAYQNPTLTMRLSFQYQ
jgi:periplasmic protein TonB